jgi:hypothetical protein
MRYQVLGCALLLAAAASPCPAAAQRQPGDRSYGWYWGAQGGAFYYQTNTQGYYFDPVVGAHWLVTAGRTALYVAYEQAWFLVDAKAQIADPNSSSGLRDVSFHDMRRLMFGVLSFPIQKRIQPFLGSGFALMQVLNPRVDCSGTTPNSDCTSLSGRIAAEEKAQDAASKAFFWLMGGAQLTRGRMSLFGHYVFTSSAKNFLLAGTTHTFQGGIRWSLGTSKEGG